MKFLQRLCMLCGIVAIPAILSSQTVFNVALDSTLTGSNSHAKGTAYVILSPDGKSATYRVSVNGLSSAITAAHFHLSPSGAIIQPINTFVGNTSTGTWSNFADTLIKYLSQEGIYINVHTTNFANGEIRGKFKGRQAGIVFNIDGPTAGTGSSGTGTGYMSWVHGGGDTVFASYRITFGGLTGTYSAAHFHSSPSTSIIQQILFVPGTDFANTVEGALVNFGDSVYTQLLRGNVYVNIHSSTSPNGEIRGNSVNIGETAFTGSADGTQASTASPGKGTVWAVLSKNLSSIKYSATYTTVQGTYSASHFHGAAGTVVQGATMTNNHVTGTWSNPSDQNIIDFIKGKTYFNIHSSTNPNGDIRANMSFQDGVFAAVIDGGQAGTISTAKGTGWLNISANTPTYDITYAGLGSALTGSHFHAAPSGAVVQPITNFSGGYVHDTWNMTTTNYEDLFKAHLYINLHSTNFPNGEIRGNIGEGSNQPTSVQLVDGAVPGQFSLGQNYPNPFNPTTKFEFQIADRGFVKLLVFDLLGREVATLVNEERIAGTHQVTFNASALPTGMYFYRLSFDGRIADTKKMVLVK